MCGDVRKLLWPWEHDCSVCSERATRAAVLVNVDGVVLLISVRVRHCWQVAQLLG